MTGLQPCTTPGCKTLTVYAVCSQCRRDVAAGRDPTSGRRLKVGRTAPTASKQGGA